MRDEITNPYEIRLAERRFDPSRIRRRIACCLYFGWLRYRRWRIANESIRHLESLDDHRLDDIGIARSDIAAAVHGRPEQEQKSEFSGIPDRSAIIRNSRAT